MTSGSETTDPLNVYIGARIREERMASGLTQSRLGAAIGVTFHLLQMIFPLREKPSAARKSNNSRQINAMSFSFSAVANTPSSLNHRWNHLLGNAPGGHPSKLAAQANNVTCRRKAVVTWMFSGG